MNAGKFKIGYNSIGELAIGIDGGDVIPDDEPIFIIRARDKHAIMALAKYASECRHGQQVKEIFIRIQEFKKWREENADKVQEPDGRM